MTEVFISSSTDCFTSTTAPGKTFASRTELANHYKSDWHKYNLKRREAGLALLQEVDFQARWEAALALRKEKEAKAHNGKDHLKDSKKNSKKRNKQQQDETTTTVAATTSTTMTDAASSTPIETAVGDTPVPMETAEIEEIPDIHPNQSLFDAHISETLEENVEYMHKHYGFFLPDQGKEAHSPSSLSSKCSTTDLLMLIVFPCLSYAFSFFFVCIRILGGSRGTAWI
jgi:pre-60S factor REI1